MSNNPYSCTRCGRELTHVASYDVEFTVRLESTGESLESGHITYCADHVPEEMSNDTSHYLDNCAQCNRVFMNEPAYEVEYSMYPDSSGFALDTGHLAYCADHAPQEMVDDE